MQYDPEIYKLLLAWLVSYTLVAPIIVLVNYFLSFYFGSKTIFSLYPTTSPLLLISSEFTYMTIVFVKTIWAYKHVLHKKRYYPETVDEFRDFILLYIAIHILIDILWTIVVNNLTGKVGFLKFLQNYSHELGVWSLIRPLIVGITLLIFTNVVIKYIGDLEAIGIVFFSLFMIIIASF